MDEERQPSQLGSHELLLRSQQEADDPDRIFATIFVEKFPVPFVHVQVLLEIFEHDDAIFAFVQIREDWQRLAGDFDFVSETGGNKK